MLLTSNLKRPSWRDDHRGDPIELADELRRAAIAVRDLEVEADDARSLFNEVLEPESYAQLCDHLAVNIDLEGGR